MWYEFVPVIGIIGAFLAVPPIVARVGNYFFLNGKVIKSNVITIALTS